MGKGDLRKAEDVLIDWTRMSYIDCFMLSKICATCIPGSGEEVEYSPEAASRMTEALAKAKTHRAGCEIASTVDQAIDGLIWRLAGTGEIQIVFIRIVAAITGQFVNLPPSIVCQPFCTKPLGRNQIKMLHECQTITSEKERALLDILESSGLLDNQEDYQTIYLDGRQILYRE